MKAQVNLDFLMKFFISTVAVLLVILSVYEFGTQMSNFFGMKFELKNPKISGGNLEKLEIEILSNTSKSLSYSECLGLCDKGDICPDYCSFECNQTDPPSCLLYNYSVRVFVPERGDGSVYLAYKNESDGKMVKYTEEKTFMLLPGDNFLNMFFIIPKSTEKKDMNLTLSFLGGSVSTSAGKIPFLDCAMYDESCDEKPCCKIGYKNNEWGPETLNEGSSVSNDFGNGIIFASLDGLCKNDKSSYCVLNVSCGDVYQIYQFENDTEQQFGINFLSGDCTFKLIDGDQLNLTVNYMQLASLQCNNGKCE